MTANWYCIFY